MKDKESFKNIAIVSGLVKRMSKDEKILVAASLSMRDTPISNISNNLDPEFIDVAPLKRNVDIQRKITTLLLVMVAIVLLLFILGVLPGESWIHMISNYVLGYCIGWSVANITISRASLKFWTKALVISMDYAKEALREGKRAKKYEKHKDKDK